VAAEPDETEVESIHANSKIEEVLLSRLQIDWSYQRDISEAVVDEIAADWDIVASELILVSNRGTRPADGEIKGGLFVVNGQHRSKAAQKKGMTKIWARVIDLRKHEDPGSVEAGFRLKTNKRLGDRPLERFKAQLRSGNEESLAIVKILKKLETEINQAAQPETGINCVATIEQVYRYDDGQLLSDTGKLIVDTFKYFGGKNAHSAFIKGTAWFIDKHAEEANRERFIGRLQSLGQGTLVTRARATGLTMGGSLWLNYYRAMVELYNEGLRERNRLHWKYRGSGSLESAKAGAVNRS
jgi:hypothetical protein